MRHFSVLPAVAAALCAVLVGAAPAQAAAIPGFPAPKIFGTTFQSDPGHDFSKGISSRRDGILRGWITHVSAGEAEYEPIRWVKGGKTEGRFTGPPEGDVTAYRSPVAKNVVFLSVTGCSRGAAAPTVNGKGLGTERCSRKELLSRAAKSERPSLITVYRGKIVKVQEIYTP
ncbi:hypothetical protein FHS43_005047 [Streptosporangium becharense]|uniref:Uncharacterized protein n=1 Tax=Streptosporangium becharense TaxID=1816182 RepID=A0A7W9IBT9_9ACTN|nr:hypothetical protein [Streptosporangium becharense]MBB2913738.1 hypothetical protein [Streptosporangium becharense]MBB5817819.1 hypothetical protein [Streptosporangium becharense]